MQRDLLSESALYIGCCKISASQSAVATARKVISPYLSSAVSISRHPRILELNQESSQTSNAFFHPCLSAKANLPMGFGNAYEWTVHRETVWCFFGGESCFGFKDFPFSCLSYCLANFDVFFQNRGRKVELMNRSRSVIREENKSEGDAVIRNTTVATIT